MMDLTEVAIEHTREAAIYDFLIALLCILVYICGAV